MKTFLRRAVCATSLGVLCCCAVRSSAKTETVPLPRGIDQIAGGGEAVSPTVLPGLHFKLLAPARCVLGEPIEITMRISYDGDEKVYADRIDFDRSGRVAAYGFSATDASGNAVRDPAAAFLGGEGGGAVYKGKLSKEQPYEQKVAVNQWLAFDKPGVYTLRARAAIVRREDNPDRNSPMELQSEALQIEVVAPSMEERARYLDIAKSVLPTEDREIDQNNRQMRFEIVQRLRFMLDERAIPLLVGALGDGWINVRFEALLGLRAFKNLTLVKAELLRVLNDPNATVSPNAQNEILALLIEADKQNGILVTAATVAPYNKMLSDKLTRDIGKLPLVQSLEMTVAAMDSYQLSRVEADHWNRVLDGAALMSSDSQRKAAELLLNVLTVDARQDTPLPNAAIWKMRVALLKTARDEAVLGALRSDSIVALARIGDFSQRELLVREFKKAQPLLWKPDEWGHVWSQAQKGLTSDQKREIALQLLGFLNAPDFFKQDYYPKRSVILRLSDFGGALSEKQLTAATKRVIEYSKDDQESASMLYALASRSPDDAIRIIEKLPSGNPKDHDTLRTDLILFVVARLDTRRARRFTQQLFVSPDARERAAIISGFARSAQEARDRYLYLQTQRGLPMRPDLARRYFSQILRAFQTDTSREVRTVAFYALTQISNIPDFASYDTKNADDKSFIPQWIAWQKANVHRK